MLAALLNLPKWLMALVAACVLMGHCQQVECKLTGCAPTVAAQADTADHGDQSAPQSDAQDCQCQCHLVMLSFHDLMPTCIGFAPVSSASHFAWIEHAPEAPCADIEHPPQLA